MKLTVCTINVLGFIFYLIFYLVIWSLGAAMWGLPNRLDLPTLLGLTPFPYFLLSILTCFARRRSKDLLVTGITSHTIFATYAIGMLWSESAGWPFVLFLLYTLAWFAMYWGLPEGTCA